MEETINDEANHKQTEIQAKPTEIEANPKTAEPVVDKKPAAIPMAAAIPMPTHQEPVSPFHHPWTPSPDEELPKYVGLDCGEIALQPGQELKVVQHVKYYAVMPHKENITKIHEKAEKVEAARNPPTPAPHHSTDGGHITHHTRR